MFCNTIPRKLNKLWNSNCVVSMLFLNLSKLQSEELLKTFMNHKTQRKGTVFGIMVSDIMSADCTSTVFRFYLSTVLSIEKNYLYLDTCKYILVLAHPWLWHTQRAIITITSTWLIVSGKTLVVFVSCLLLTEFVLWWIKDQLLPDWSEKDRQWTQIRGILLKHPLPQRNTRYLRYHRSLIHHKTNSVRNRHDTKTTDVLPESIMWKWLL